MCLVYPVRQSERLLLEIKAEKNMTALLDELDRQHVSVVEVQQNAPGQD